MVGNIGGFLIVWLLLASMITWRWRDLPISDTLSISFLIWACVYFPFFFKHFWGISDPNYGVVLQRLSSTKETSNVDSAGNINDTTFIPPGQRGVTAPFYAKSIFEVLVAAPIHLGKMVPLGTTLELRDMNGSLFRVDWQAFMSALRDERYLPRYHLVDEVAATKFFTTGYQAILIAMFVVRDGKAIMASLDSTNEKENFNTVFSTAYSGDRKIHPDEIEHGRTLKDAKVGNIVPINKVAEAMQLKEVAEAIAVAIKILVKSGVHVKDATRIIMSENGGIEFSDIQFSGGVPSGEALEALLRQRGQGRNKRRRNR